MYRILIVEDDPVIAGAVADKAARWGLETRAVEDFSRVMSDFAEFSPHIVLLDISLPALRRISLVPRDTRRVEDACHLHLLSVRQHEHNNGDEPGRGRLHIEAVRHRRADS